MTADDVPPQEFNTARPCGVPVAVPNRPAATMTGKEYLLRRALADGLTAGWVHAAVTKKTDIDFKA